MSIFDQITVILLAVFAALIASIVIRVILYTRLVFFFADTPNHRKVHSAPIPRVGGIAIIIAVLAVTLIWHILTFQLGVDPVPEELFISILAAAISLGVLGFLDDTRFVAIRVRHKLAVVIALAAATVFLFGVHPGAISVFGLFAIPEPISKIIAVMWIVGLINAYNLVDGLDGFAGTITILSLLGLMAVSILTGCGSTAVLSVFAVGAVAGFMLHNAPPARVFMGDTGSCFLGYIVALLTIRAAYLMELSGNSGKTLVIMPLLVGIPILEVVVTILRRYFSANGRGFKQILNYIVTADRSHLHHRFLFRGFSHLQTCILVGILTATIVAGAICITLAPISYMPLILAYIAIPVAVVLYKLGLGGQIRMILRRQIGKPREDQRPKNDAVTQAKGGGS